MMVEPLGRRLQPLHFFFIRLRRPLTSTLFPYTTLFRSIPLSDREVVGGGDQVRAVGRPREGVQRVAMAAERLLEGDAGRSEEHTSELQSRLHLVCRLLLEKKKHM